MRPAMTMQLFKGTRGAKNARILIVGEAYGHYEKIKGQPFTGPSGAELDRMLAAAGIEPSTTLMTNLVNDQPPGNEFTHFLEPGRRAPAYRHLHPTPKLQAGLAALEALIRHVSPDLIIGCGNYPLWFFTDRATIRTVASYRVPTGIAKLRGSQLVSRFGIPYLPVIHPAAILRSPSYGPATIQDLGRAKNVHEWSPPKVHYVSSPSYQECLETIGAFLRRAQHSTLTLSVDLETHAGRIRTIALSDSPTWAICIPFIRLAAFDDGSSRTTNYFSSGEFDTICRRLRTLFAHPNVELIGQNFLYDLAYISTYLAVVPRVRTDTMLAQHLCFPGTPKSLDYLASLYCSHYIYWKDDLKNSNEAGDDVGAWSYNCEDAARTYEIAGVLERTIEQLGLKTQWKFQMEYFWTCFQKNCRGIKVDLSARTRKRMELIEKIEGLRAWLTAVMPPEFLKPKQKAPWYASPKQTADLFYGTLSIRPVLHKKTRRPTMDDTALTELAERVPALRLIFEVLQQYRSSAVFLNTFLTAPLDPDGRLRSSFNLGGTETFRLSSSSNAFGRGLNLQNIPTNPTED